jgi:hypothetical protein
MVKWRERLAASVPGDKAFFFEKKKQKTFDSLSRTRRPGESQA